MTTTRTDDTRIEQSGELLAPMQIMRELRANETVLSHVAHARSAIHDVLRGADDRLFIVVGPCSIHDPVAAIDYAKRLKPLADELAHEIVVVMRVYFEKPRTTVGWKGLINDPHLDESFDINEGLRLARKLLLEINEIGLPCATEFLDLISPQYIADLVSWGAIGARTTESQSHRQLASGLSCPVGFKNGTDGSLRIAADAIKAAAARHHFISITKSGHVGVFSTSGNEDTHVILRGGKTPNYDAASVDAACKELAAAGLRQQVMIDFSHANSSKQYQRQIDVGADVAAQVAGGDTRIIGMMIESHLTAGRQDLVPGQPLAYAQSITDACISWDDTVPLLRMLADAVKKRRLTLPADEE
ncbi:MAG TPA: 3-deoxy-7-phosphoheptulonate synthase [Thiobacillus sp.]|nr:MAG: 3-deoxy-7-phosphoheptulonate synthase [Hydrogenophilales bacterium 28-61-11]OYZ57995.1 MAG: 3-deoxy-7-phosphoheptulonate synthase [Hydrogenophilales bacterium 16-61-112]OZA44063.1 MAG: 3-deoxy-7-phosphoheptulonate synthase [Hydrogenophilales bacterium 17-61-76]HQT30820.1 3-deoxy-7-phosphoheptulonate synthase [Thiobacillus sp.]HQT69624.1 3-deoxy-7-phosphoheptulonate synthase [Thiobacillus sp.]